MFDKQNNQHRHRHRRRRSRFSSLSPFRFVFNFCLLFFLSYLTYFVCLYAFVSYWLVSVCSVILPCFFCAWFFFTFGKDAIAIALQFTCFMCGASIPFWLFGRLFVCLFVCLTWMLGCLMMIFVRFGCLLAAGWKAWLVLIVVLGF